MTMDPYPTTTNPMTIDPTTTDPMTMDPMNAKKWVTAANGVPTNDPSCGNTGNFETESKMP